MKEYSYADAGLRCASEYLLPVIQRHLKGLPRGSVLLDLGCGNGSILGSLREYGFRLNGIEVSISGLSEARKAYPGIEFFHADLTSDLSSHPLAGKCDIIISTEVIEHVFLPRAFAKNCNVLLNSSGILMISTPYHGYLKNVMIAVAGKTDSHFTALWDFGHIKFWSRKTLTVLLTEAGFRVERFVGAGRIPWLWKSMLLIAKKETITPSGQE